MNRNRGKSTPFSHRKVQIASFLAGFAKKIPTKVAEEIAEKARRFWGRGIKVAALLHFQHCSDFRTPSSCVLLRLSVHFLGRGSFTKSRVASLHGPTFKKKRQKLDSGFAGRRGEIAHELETWPQDPSLARFFPTFPVRPKSILWQLFLISQI